MVEQGADSSAGPGRAGGGWTLVPSISAVIKYSCFLCWSREKTSVEQEIKENVESVGQKTCEIQELQEEVQRESGELRQLQTQRWQVQEVLGQLEQKRGALEGQLGHIRQQCSLENQLILTLQREQRQQEQQINECEEELERAQEALRRLREEAARAGERLEATRDQLGPLRAHVSNSHASIVQLQQKLDELQADQKEAVNWHMATPLKEELVLPTNRGVGVMADHQIKADPLQQGRGQPEWEVEEAPKTPNEQKHKADMSDDLNSSCWVQRTTRSSRSSSTFEVTAAGVEEPQEFINDSTFKVTSPEEAEPVHQSKAPTITTLDFFHPDPFTDSDPFEDSPFVAVAVSDLFSRDPFKGTDPFSSDTVFGQSSAEPFPFNCQLSVRVEEAVLLENGLNGPVPSVSELDGQAAQETFRPKEQTGVNPYPLALSLDVCGSLNDLSPEVEEPYLLGNTVALCDSHPDPFAEASGCLPLVEGFADFSRLSKSFSVESLASASTENQDYSSTSSAEDGEDENLDMPPTSPTRFPPLPPETMLLGM